MKRKKLVSLLLAASMMAAGLSACGQSDAAAGNSAASSKSEEKADGAASESKETGSSSDSAAGGSSASDAESTDGSHYPVTIENYNSAKEPTEYTFTSAPENVVTIWTNSVENMLALGLGDRITLAAGVSEEDILPEYQEEFAKVKESASQYPPKEDIVALEPDFILGWYSTFSDEKYWSDTDFWNERNINTYIGLNSGVMPDQTIQNEFDDILNLGKIFDVEDKAQELVNGMEDKIEAGRAYAEGKEPVRVLILENEGDAFRNYGENSIGGSIATQVGAEICEPDQSVRIGAEDLLNYDPDVIYAAYFGDEEGKAQCVSDFTDNPAFASLSAVQNGKVYPIDLSLIYSPGVRVSNAIDYFLETLYPEMNS